ncbi:hypothetical protein [Vibrio alginolyticus]|uniref:hypothetical protein n=1 Tax=Vibrio alginolyticus TaxID=663 RepID=UPI0018E32A75|nr:hypothetical protein [Vibrio alginolyticus]
MQYPTNLSTTHVHLGITEQVSGVVLIGIRFVKRRITSILRTIRPPALDGIDTSIGCPTQDCAVVAS